MDILNAVLLQGQSKTQCEWEWIWLHAPLRQWAYSRFHPFSSHQRHCKEDIFLGNSSLTAVTQGTVSYRSYTSTLQDCTCMLRAACIRTPPSFAPTLHQHSTPQPNSIITSRSKPEDISEMSSANRQSLSIISEIHLSEMTNHTYRGVVWSWMTVVFRQQTVHKKN